MSSYPPLPAQSPVYLTILTTGLLTHLPIKPSTDHPTYLTTFLCANLPSHLLTQPPTNNPSTYLYPPDHLRNQQPSHPPTYPPPIYPTTYLATYLHNHLLMDPPTYPTYHLPNQFLTCTIYLYYHLPTHRTISVINNLHIHLPTHLQSTQPPTLPPTYTTTYSWIHLYLPNLPST